MINQKTFSKATINIGDEAEVALDGLDADVEAAAEAVAKKLQADAEEAREAYIIALTHYLDAAEKLSESWDDNMNPANYPKYLPSFDQHALDIRTWLEAEVGKP